MAWFSFSQPVCKLAFWGHNLKEAQKVGQGRNHWRPGGLGILGSQPGSFRTQLILWCGPLQPRPNLSIVEVAPTE